MAKIPTPSADDLHIAAQWLDIYEGAEDAAACHRVAAWLLQKSDDAELRAACRDSGVSVAKARQAMQARKKA
ncbi:hypothetical protein [Nevskia sp.]|uniref:hypothetical protein n=1 Tax=Nevskia sp. TaxID=1929292 RepID=UPI0025F629B3|nr:hypothetical protein [Nevskia sp.]